MASVADKLVEGSAVWADFQATWMQTLRNATGKEKDAPPQTSEIRIVFVEPRKHPATEFVLRNLRHCLPTCPITIVHGTKNAEFMKAVTSQVHGDFTFLSCRLADLPNRAYNTLFTRPEFWKAEELGREPWLLVAQTDTCFLQPAEDWLKAFTAQPDAPSFLGAPWSLSCQLCQAALRDDCGHMIDQRLLNSMAPGMVGNGGLSLRRKEHMVLAATAYRLDVELDAKVVQAWGGDDGAPKLLGSSNEDVFFCKALQMLGHKVADRVTALRFAIEQVPPLEWPIGKPPALGCHKPWVYLPPPLVRSIFKSAQL